MIGKEEEKASQKTGNEKSLAFFHIAVIFLKESEKLLWEGYLCTRKGCLFQTKY